MSNELVLVTGGSGFIGAHLILQLLAAGYRVRTTVRSLTREPEVRAMLLRGGASRDALDQRLSFIAADLLQDANWTEAVRGCTYIHHVASPFPVAAPKHEDELIIPAREGTLRVLRAARDAHATDAAVARRVILTSSYAAIGYGRDERESFLTEEDWSNPDARDLAPYPKSKTIAELAAWDFIAREGHGLELTTVNPVAVFGPVLSADYSSSITVIERMMTGKVPGLPKISFGVVDVRDIAALHLLAMTHPEAAGQRYLAVTGDFLPIREIARLLKEHLGPAGASVPTREVPDWLLRVAARFDSSLRVILAELGKSKNASNAKALALGWEPHSAAEAIAATADSLLQLGLLDAK